MKQLQLVPTIYEYESFADFAKEFQLTEKDLILTNEYIYKPTIAPTGVPCKTIFQERFGGGEPTDLMINSVLAEMNTMECDRIIAVGGGTIIDIAKVLSVSDHETDVNDMYDHMAALKRCHELFIIPTTCGTGSEVTNLSIINRTKLGTKQGLVSEAMYCTHAVLIGEFIKTLPYGVFATSSIDALIHAVESYLSPLCTPYTEMFSVAAIREIIAGYRAVAEDPSCRAALGGRFLRAANYAGIAFGNAGCGTIHAMSYALGGKYHVAHGESNYQFFVPVLSYYKQQNPTGKIASLEVLLSECCGTESGIDGLKALLERILPHKPMSAYGAVQEDIHPFAVSTMANQQRLLARSYVPLTEAEVEALFQGCLN